MKPARFDYQQAQNVAEISSALMGDQAVKILAGGQSLGPMLNLRLVQPTLLVDITRVAELKQVNETHEDILIGACVTHANIEDGCVPGATGRVLASIARGIAYRAVRNRGTLGGSLAHADPSADWISTLMALDAELSVRKGTKVRQLRLLNSMSGPFDIGLEQGEWVEAVRIPIVSHESGWGYAKIVRKTGEFAHAMAAVLQDPARDCMRIVIGATETSPVVIEEKCPATSQLNLEDIKRKALAQLEDAGVTDPIDNRVRLVAIERALNKSRYSSPL